MKTGTTHAAKDWRYIMLCTVCRYSRYMYVSLYRYQQTIINIISIIIIIIMSTAAAAASALQQRCSKHCGKASWTLEASD